MWCGVGSSENYQVMSKLAKREQAPTFRVDIRVRNNRILRAIERAGYKSQAEAGRALGLAATDVCSYVAFRRAPLADDGTWKESALRLADGLFADPADLWPEEARAVMKANASFEASFAELQAFVGSDAVDASLIEHAVDVRGLRGLLADAKTKLHPRLKEAVDAYYNGEETFEAVGERLGVSRERARQLIVRGIEELRKEMNPKLGAKKP
jgi:RNA polymerase sigma factor (sigma-70 family)